MDYLTKYRIELLGLGMMLIIFFHSSIEIPSYLSPLKFLQFMGYVGVEVFFLLSGVGLIYSYTKKPDLKTFFRKRLLRVLPVFWACLILIHVKNIIVGEFSASDLILAASGLDFLIYGVLDTWFIPAILICYLLFPLYYFISNKFGFAKSFVFSTIIILLFALFISNSSFQYLLVFVIRLPVFFLGVYLGNLIISDTKHEFLSSKWLVSFILFLGLVLLVLAVKVVSTPNMWAYGLFWYPTILMAYPICVLLGFGISKLEIYFPYLNKMIRPFGIYSLEMYLLHGLIFSLSNKLPFKDLDMNFLRIPEYILYVLIAFLLSLLVNRLVTLLQLKKAT